MSSRKPKVKNVKHLKEAIEKKKKLEEEEKKKYDEMVKREEERAKLRKKEGGRKKNMKFKDLFFRLEDNEKCFLVKFDGLTVSDLIRQINEENDFKIEEIGSIQKMRRKEVKDLDTDPDSKIFDKVNPFDILILRKEKPFVENEEEGEEEDVII